MKFTLKPIIPLVAIVAILEWLSRTGKVPIFLMPAPSQVLQCVIDDPSSFKKHSLKRLRLRCWDYS